MGLLGHVLSIVSGKSYETLVQNLITKNLGMPNTFITLNDLTVANFASGHHLKQEVGYWDIPGLAGAGALRSTIKDMANFLAANMEKSKSPTHSLIRQCHEKQHSLTPNFAVGLGWMLSTSNLAELIWHNGGTGGFRSYIGFNSKLQKGVVILSNSTEDWPDEFALHMLDPDYQRPLIDKSLANNVDYLNKFVGSYEVMLKGDKSKQKLQISVFGKLLALKFSGGEVGMLYAESYGVFGIKGFRDGKVFFSFDEIGNITKVETRLISGGVLLWEAIPQLED